MSKLLKLFIFSTLVTTLLILGGGYYLYSQTHPVTSSESDSVRFVIPKGQAISVIANRLAEQKLIRQPLVFRLWLKQQGLESKIQAGSFTLAPQMTLAEIADTLTTGTDDVWITIPEGWRMEEIADSLAKQDLTAFDKDEFLELADASEGKLYPDTYLISKDSTAATIYNLLTNTFDQKIVKGLAKEIAASDHTLDEALVMASLIEREALGETQMKHISGILWHRIEIGMPLQVDATLQYSKGYNKIQQSWWVPPLAEDKKLPSSFNTYLNPGLPPRPIASPGIEAIRAALNPDQVDDLFYIHDRDGVMHFAKTLEQHNANVQKYLR